MECLDRFADTAIADNVLAVSSGLVLSSPPIYNVFKCLCEMLTYIQKGMPNATLAISFLRAISALTVET